LSAEVQPARDARPLVALVCSVPLVSEAVSAALAFAEVRSFAGRKDTSGLLQWLHPDAVVVDNDDDARDASAFAQENGGVPVLHISIHDRSLRLFRDGLWQDVATVEGPTPETIHNILAGSLFAREGR
jgi:hypothetical protein